MYTEMLHLWASLTDPSVINLIYLTEERGVSACNKTGTHHINLHYSNLPTGKVPPPLTLETEQKTYLKKNCNARQHILKTRPRTQDQQELFDKRNGNLYKGISQHLILCSSPTL